MRILALADAEESWLTAERFDSKRLEGIDLIVSCGDLSADYLSFIATVQPKPVVYVPGNHDLSYGERPPEGCVCVDGRVLDFHGLRLAGLGGSMWYGGRALGYTEDQMSWRVARLVLMAQSTGGVDLVVTHAPVAGYGDLDDLPHTGFDCFGRLLERLNPSVLVHGHVHMNYGHVARELAHPCGSRLVNAYGSYVLDVAPGEHKGLFKPEKL